MVVDLLRLIVLFETGHMPALLVPSIPRFVMVLAHCFYPAVEGALM